MKELLKTSEEITHEAFKYYLDKNNVLVNKAFADGAEWAQNELIPFIRVMEARNKGLEEEVKFLEKHQEFVSKIGAYINNKKQK